jgi:hypothetical protein
MLIINSLHQISSFIARSGNSHQYRPLYLPLSRDMKGEELSSTSSILNIIFANMKT